MHKPLYSEMTRNPLARVCATNRQPPTDANRHQPPTAANRRPLNQKRSHDHEAESVSVNVRFCWRYDRFFFPLKCRPIVYLNMSGLLDGPFILIFVLIEKLLLFYFHFYRKIYFYFYIFIKKICFILNRQYFSFY